jgi:hypothetical protein
MAARKIGHEASRWFARDRSTPQPPLGGIRLFARARVGSARPF